MKNSLLPVAKSLLPLAGLLAFSTPAIAQVVPSTMNFQGRLAKPDGTPVSNGVYTVTFSLYTAATGGTLLWQKSVTGIAVRNGAFAARLDYSSGFQNGATLASAFGGSAIYLDISINGSASLTPRQQLVSNAYAFTANTALAISNGGVTASAFAPNLFNPIAWLLGGNSGVTSGFLGTTDNQPLVFKVNSHQAMRYSYAENTTDPNPANQYRSVNVIGGSELNSVMAGMVGATISGGGQNYFSGTSYPNSIICNFGTIGGGAGNTAGGNDFTTVGGGFSNTAGGGYATVAGGDNNGAFAYFSSVGGGGYNHAYYQYSTIAGGIFNNANDGGTAIAGGIFNTATGSYSVIGGGRNNATKGFDDATLEGVYATVSGGFTNTASALGATAAGGLYNTAAGQYSFAAGQQAQANHDGSFVWNDSTAAADNATFFASTGVNQFLVHATGGVGINTNNPAGYALHVAGTGKFDGNLTVNSTTYTSDARYKTHIALLSSALDDLLALRGVSYDWDRAKWPEKNFSEGRQFGFIAQDLEKIFPELVLTDAQGYKSVNYIGVIPVLVEGMKAQQKQIEQLKADNAELKKQNARITDIEKQLAELLAGRKKQDQK